MKSGGHLLTMDSSAPNVGIYYKMMEIWAESWTKTHKGCGGLVRFVENTGELTNCGWLLQCIKCNRLVYEEDVDFKNEKTKK